MMYYPAEADPEDVLWDMCDKLWQLITNMEGFADYYFYADDPALAAKCKDGLDQQVTLSTVILDDIKAYLINRQEM